MEILIIEEMDQMRCQIFFHLLIWMEIMWFQFMLVKIIIVFIYLPLK